MRRFYARLFFIAAAIRFLCVPVFVIDDDEAWSSAASLAMKSPWQFYRSAVDHKPPGFVWFYWFVNHIVPCASDPRVVRAAFTLLGLLAAVVVGLIALRLERRAAEKRSSAIDSGNAGEVASEIGWCAATIFLLITALPAPKLLAVTADGLIAYLVVFAYAAALFWEGPVAALTSGMLLGLALLVKQTSVFFAIPILFARWPRKWSWKEIPLFALGAAFVLVPCIFGLGVSDFFYWNWIYPKQVLIEVRAHLFESNLEGLETLVLYALAILPLIWVMARKMVRSGSVGILRGLRDFRVLWLLAGFCGFALGKGLFLHYLLLIAPPVSLLAADALSRASGRASEGSRKLPWKTFSWLGVQYVAGCLILTIPSSGVFWGTDLVYFKALSRVMSASLRPGEKVMVWGGSALPLAYARVEHVTRFVLPRFAVAPYATKLTRGIFHRELAQDPPALILDLHERGDNQFDNPIESEPFVADLVHTRYKLYVSESIPWAKFYFLNPPASGAGLLAVGGASVPALYEPFPERRESWTELQSLAEAGGFLRIGPAIARAADADWALRARASLELVERQGSGAEMRARAAFLDGQLQPGTAVSAALRAEISSFLGNEASANDGVFPVPMLSSAWWATVAMVELQPRAHK